MQLKELISMMLNEDDVTLETEVVFTSADAEIDGEPTSDFVTMEVDPGTGNLVIYHSGTV